MKIISSIPFAFRFVLQSGHSAYLVDFKISIDPHKLQNKNSLSRDFSITEPSVETNKTQHNSSQHVSIAYRNLQVVSDRLKRLTSCNRLRFAHRISKVSIFKLNKIKLYH